MLVGQSVSSMTDIGDSYQGSVTGAQQSITATASNTLQLVGEFHFLISSMWSPNDLQVCVTGTQEFKA